MPRVPSARVFDVALGPDRRRGTADRDQFTGIRPGEKIHEIMVSEEECHRTVERGDYYVVRPVLPELRLGPEVPPALDGEYSSSDARMDESKSSVKCSGSHHRRTRLDG